MSDEVTEELKDQVVEFFKQKGKMMTHRDVAKGLGIEQKLAKKALTNWSMPAHWSSHPLVAQRLSSSRMRDRPKHFEPKIVSFRR